MTLCKKCKKFVFGILEDLRQNAKKRKRDTIVGDTIDDVEISLEEGDISSVEKRDKDFISGVGGRKIKK